MGGIFLGLHYTSDLNSAYFSLFFLIREMLYGWCLRYFHSSGASFVFLFLNLLFGSWVYRLMIQFIVLSSFFLQDYISFIFSLVFFFYVFSFGVVVFLSKFIICCH